MAFSSHLREGYFDDLASGRVKDWIVRLEDHMALQLLMDGNQRVRLGDLED